MLGSFVNSEERQITEASRECSGNGCSSLRKESSQFWGRVLSAAAVAIGAVAAVVVVLRFCGIDNIRDLAPGSMGPLAGMVVNIRYSPPMEHLAREAEAELRKAGARVDQVLAREMLSGIWVSYAEDERRKDAVRVVEALAGLGVKVQLIGEATDRYATGSTDESCVLVIGEEP